MSHTCHAHGCAQSTPPRMLFCYPHWKGLDRRIQDAIWAEYRAGQETDKDPSLRYLAVQQYAIAAVVFKPNDEAAALLAVPYLARSILHRRAAIAAGDGDPLPWVQLTADEGDTR
jgi:hypothetical protein